MIRRISGPLGRGVLALVLASALAACSRSDGTRILGHWRAERIKVQSLSLPMGPDFVVTPQALMSLDGEIRIPISATLEEGNMVTLEAPLGLGLSFYFENGDRMYFDMPLAGRVYFQRVSDTTQPTAARPLAAPDLPARSELSAAPAPAPAAPEAPPSPPPQAALLAPLNEAGARGTTQVDLIREAERKLAGNRLAEARALLMQAHLQYGEDPMVDYNLAILNMRDGDTDSAVRKLRDAFEHGFRAFALLDACEDLAPLKTDPRYNALLIRYH